MPDTILARDTARDDAWFAARMTNIQFEALACRLNPRRIESDLRASLLTRRPRRGTACDLADISRWLVNGWSTEQLLLTNSEQLVGDALRHSLHWAFPQAYYSVFAVTLGYFKAVGFTEMSHAAVIRKFGTQAEADRYPIAVACTSSGGKEKTFRNLSPIPLETSLSFSSEVPELVDAQLVQFLGATRDLDLREKKSDIRIPTARGGRKRSFNAVDWERVSSALGPTSILSLLYRKRIKANYRDIDSFLHEEINAEVLYQNLLRVVGAINFVHEVYLACMLSCETLESVIGRMPDRMGERPRSRSAFVRNLVTG